MLRIIFLFIILIFTSFLNHSFAEEFEITIPFGAYNPELNTPAEVWYDPPVLAIEINDSGRLDQN